MNNDEARTPTANLPQGWVCAKLPDLARVNPPLECCVIDDSTPVNFVPMRAVEPDGGGLARPEVRTFAKVKKGYTSFLSGDVIMAKITPCMENGKITVVPQLPGSICFGSTEFHVLRAEEGVEPSWLGYYLLGSDLRRRARMHMAGAVGQLRVPQSFLETVELPLAPTGEQRRILDEVEELLSDLDAGVAALKRAQQKLALYRAAVLKAAVAGELTADWRREHPNVEPASVLIERLLAERRRLWEEEQLRRFEAARKTPPNNWRAKYREPAPPDTTKLPVLPAGWCWACIDQIGEIQGGLQKTPSRAPVNHHFPYLRVANVQRGSLDLAELETFEVTRDELDRLRLQRGDLLIVEGNGSRGEIGRCAMWRGEVHDCIHQNHIIRVRPVPGMLGEYLDLFMNSPIGQGRIQLVASSTSGLYTLSVSKIKQLVVPVPPSAEQELIVDTVEDQLSMVDHVQADVEGKVKTAQAQRQAILRQAFEGQLVRQDSRDEPASEILKRIGAAREERARQQAGTRRGGNCRGASPKAREAQFVGHR